LPFRPEVDDEQQAMDLHRVRRHEWKRSNGASDPRRATQPVRMLNGRWGSLFQPAAQQRLFELLGSPADQKKRVLFEAGHGNLPRFQVEEETLQWLDRHLVAVPVPLAGATDHLERDGG
jgi:hypothetical protein